jgi:hypothetical protein
MIGVDVLKAVIPWSGPGHNPLRHRAMYSFPSFSFSWETHVKNDIILSLLIGGGGGGGPHDPRIEKSRTL